MVTRTPATPCKLICEEFLERDIIKLWLAESDTLLLSSAKAAGEGEREMYWVEVAVV